MGLIVQKYGGASLATVEDIKKVASRVAKLKSIGKSLIVVVSAMGKTTDELTKLAYQTSSEPHSREMDMLLSSGERVSMALMSMALNNLGCDAISFTGSQAGILTKGTHNDSHIVEVRPHRVEAELKNGKVVVLAGFQGVNPNTKEVTTLGRGGSDITAVAMASHFKAKSCQILKDVDGVFTADPMAIPKANIIPHLNYETLGGMCQLGCKVLHPRAVKYAEETQVLLQISHAHHDDSVGTIVNGENLHNKGPLALNKCANVIRVRLVDKNLQQLINLFVEHDLSIPVVLNEELANGISTVTLKLDPGLEISQIRMLQTYFSDGDLKVNYYVYSLSFSSPEEMERYLLKYKKTPENSFVFRKSHFCIWDHQNWELKKEHVPQCIADFVHHHSA